MLKCNNNVIKGEWVMNQCYTNWYVPEGSNVVMKLLHQYFSPYFRIECLASGLGAESSPGKSSRRAHVSKVKSGTSGAAKELRASSQWDQTACASSRLPTSYARSYGTEYNAMLSLESLASYYCVQVWMSPFDLPILNIAFARNPRSTLSVL
jgi:hypothetical protein